MTGYTNSHHTLPTDRIGKVEGIITRIDGKILKGSDGEFG
jgi:hypothetical protein